MNLKNLIELAERAKPQYPLKKLVDEEDCVYECPLCKGEGHVDGQELEGVGASFICAYGIGQDYKSLDAFVTAASPDVVKKLCESLQICVEVLESAQETIHDEFCSSDSKHHGICKTHSDALLKIKKDLE